MPGNVEIQIILNGDGTGRRQHWTVELSAYARLVQGATCTYRGSRRVHPSSPAMVASGWSHPKLFVACKFAAPRV